MEKRLIIGRRGNFLRSVAIAVTLAAALSGCQYSCVADGERPFEDEPPLTLKEYVDYLRAAATRKPTAEERELFSDVPELSASLTTHLVKREFQVVHIDANYVSFRADMVDYHGGNGNHSSVFVGTIDRRTGAVLGVADFVSKDKWPILKQRLRAKAVQAIGGEANLQSPVEVVENFYYANDGLHFIYNPYEIACGAAGVVEVVISPREL